jgi:hypothetical protein
VQLDEEGRRETKKASISQSREREIGPETNLPVKSIFWKEKKEEIQEIQEIQSV